MSSEYELRVNGCARYYYNQIGQEQIEDFLHISKENPNVRVEIVYIVEHTVLNKFNYHQMEKHFGQIKAKDDK